MAGGKRGETGGGRLRTFPGDLSTGDEDMALATAKVRKDKARTSCTDGSRLEDGGVGAVVVWWEKVHTPELWGEVLLLSRIVGERDCCSILCYKSKSKDRLN